MAKNMFALLGAQSGSQSDEEGAQARVETKPYEAVPDNFIAVDGREEAVTEEGFEVVAHPKERKKPKKCPYCGAKGHELGTHAKLERCVL